MGNALGYRGSKNRGGKEWPNGFRKNRRNKGPYAEEGTATVPEEAPPGRRQEGKTSRGRQIIYGFVNHVGGLDFILRDAEKFKRAII